MTTPTQGPLQDADVIHADGRHGRVTIDDGRPLVVVTWRNGPTWAHTWEPREHVTPVPELMPPGTVRGWYQVPDGRLRYWNGDRWTGTVRALEPVTIEIRRKGDFVSNLMLTILTCGLWAPVWMIRAGPRYRVKRRR
jgi:hypothetical protein